MSDEHALSEEDRENLVAYLDGELDEEAARALEAKLNLDPRARGEAETMQKTWDLLDYLPRPDVSPSFTNKTLDRVSAYRPSSMSTSREGLRSWSFGAAWAAVLLLAVLGGFWGTERWARPERPPVEDPAKIDQQLVRDLRVLENRRFYENIDDVEFLKALESPDLFGEDSY